MINRYAVAASDIGVVVWIGEAADPEAACSRAAPQLGTSTGSFVRYECQPPSHKEDGVDRLVLSVYAASASFNDLGPIEPGALREEDYAGTYMAR